MVSCSANRRALTHGVYVVATTTYRTLVVQKGYKDVTTDAYGSIWLQSAPSRKKKNASGYNIFSSRRSRMIPMNSTCFLMFFESQKMEETINNDLGRSTESEVKR